MANWALLIYFATSQVYIEDRVFDSLAECEQFIFTEWQEYAMDKYEHVNEWLVPGCFEQWSTRA